MKTSNVNTLVKVYFNLSENHRLGSKLKKTYSNEKKNFINTIAPGFLNSKCPIASCCPTLWNDSIRQLQQ